MKKVSAVIIVALALFFSSTSAFCDGMPLNSSAPLPENVTFVDPDPSIGFNGGVGYWGGVAREDDNPRWPMDVVATVCEISVAATKAFYSYKAGSKTDVIPLIGIVDEKGNLYFEWDGTSGKKVRLTLTPVRKDGLIVGYKARIKTGFATTQNANLKLLK
jgi:hypothetical protein